MQRKTVCFAVFCVLTLSMFSFGELFLPQIHSQTSGTPQTINILNEHSYPIVDGNWTVNLQTGGVGQLKISGFNGTSFGTYPDDLEFLELSNGVKSFIPYHDNTSLIFSDFEGNGSFTIRVHTIGNHYLRFEFGDSVAFAYNTASPASTVKIDDSTTNGPVLANSDNFGTSIANIGDIDGDGVSDIAVGAYQDDTGGTDRGAVYIVKLNSNGSVKSTAKIANGTTNGPILVNGDNFGISVANIGDIDRDGVVDIAVGASFDDTLANGDATAGANRGAVYLIRLNSDGSVKGTAKIDDSTTNGPVLANSDNFGTSIANIGDIDRDGVNDIAVGAYQDGTGGTDRGAVYIVKLNSNGSVKSTAKIANGTTNGPVLADLDWFGASIANIGDIDRDGVNDIAVGAWHDNANSSHGAVYLIRLNSDGSVKGTAKIANGTTNGPTLAVNDFFGTSVANIGDIDRDGVNDIAVGAYQDDTGGTDRGAVYIIYLNSNSTVKSTTKIASGTTNGPTLANSDGFGWAVASIGDLNRDGVTDIAVGAWTDDTSGTDRGAVHMISLTGESTISNNRVDSYTAITANGQAGNPATNSYYGSVIANIGDIDRDGIEDIAVGPIHATNPVGCTDCGRVDIIKLNANGTPKSINYIQNGTANFATLSNSNEFGQGSIANIGDIDRDGVNDIAVGAYLDSTGGTYRGALYIIKLNADSTVKGYTKIASGTTNAPTLANSDTFGSAVANIGDIDRDGVNDVAVGASGTVNGGAVYLIRLNSDGSVKGTTKISSGTTNFVTLTIGDSFGGASSIANIGDIDRDGVNDIAVGARKDDTGGTDRGAVYLIRLNSDGSVKGTTKISSGTTNLASIVDSQTFGSAVANIGDIDRDGVNDIAVGASNDGGSAGAAGSSVKRGEVYVIRLNSDGTIKYSSKINSSTPNLSSQWGQFDDYTHFGTAVANVGDLNRDGIDEIAVGEIQGLSRVVIIFMHRGDTTKPTFSSASLNLGTRVLSITLSEQPSSVDLSKIYISPTGVSNQLVLTGASTTISGSTVNITLTEAQKQAVIAMNSPQLDILTNAVYDLDENGITAAADQTLSTTSDTTVPTFSSASLNKGTGILSITFSETVDNTPTTDVDLSKIYISQANTINQLALSGATITTVGNSSSISITLTEAQRQAVIAKTTPQLDILAAAVKDTSGNTINAIADRTISLTADTVKPTFSSALFDQPTGILSITFSETVDNTPTTDVDLSKIYISESGTTNQHVLTGATVASGNSTTINITLNSTQTTNLLAKTTPQLDILAAAVKDTSGNTINAIADRTIAVNLSTSPSQVVISSAAPSGIRQITLSWSAPNSNGSPILGYTIQRQTSGGSFTTVSESQTGLSYTNNNLVAGTSYGYKIWARNANGNGTVSAVSTVIAADIPETVVPTITAGKGYVSLSWPAPNNGGSTITGYKIERKPVGGEFTTLAASHSSTSYTDTAITAGTSYIYRITPINTIGLGTPFASAQYTPYDAPSAAQNMKIIPGDGRITITWDSVNSNGSTITEFIVQKNSTNYPTLNSHYTNVTSSNISYSGGSAGSSSSFTVSGLTNDKTYILRILPRNVGGDGQSFSNIVVVRPSASANANVYFMEPPASTESIRTIMINKGLSSDFVVPSPATVSTSAFSAFDKSFNQKLRYSEMASLSDTPTVKIRNYAVPQYTKPSGWSQNTIWAIPPAIIPLSGNAGESAVYNVTQADPLKPLYMPFTDATPLQNGGKLAGVRFALASGITANNLAVDNQFLSTPPTGVTAVPDTKMYMRFSLSATQNINYGDTATFSTPPTISFTMGGNSTYPHPTNPTNTVNASIICPAVKVFFISGSTTTTSGINISRDTAGDTSSVCGYSATLQHFSDYGASVDTSPTSSTSITSSGSSADHQAPSTTIGFSNLDYPLTIDHVGFRLPEFSNTIPTQDLEINKIHQFTVLLYENSGVDAVQHVVLFMNLKERQDQVTYSDTFVSWDKSGGIEINDPHDFVHSSDVQLIKKGNMAEVTFNIRFKEEMGKSNLIIRSWDEKRNSRDTIVYDAINVIQSSNADVQEQDHTKPDLPLKEKSIIVPIESAQKQKDVKKILLEQDEMQKNAAMLARIDAIEYKNQRLQDNQQIIDDALKITQQKLETAIAQSKQRIGQILQHYDPVERISIQDILERRELNTIAYEQMIIEKTDAEKQKTLSSFESKTPVRDYSNLLNNPEKIPNMVDYIEFLEKEKQRMIDKKQDEITTADKILFEKIQNEIKEQQRRIMETDRYYQQTYYKTLKK